MHGSTVTTSGRLVSGVSGWISALFQTNPFSRSVLLLMCTLTASLHIALATEPVQPVEPQAAEPTAAATAEPTADDSKAAGPVVQIASVENRYDILIDGKLFTSLHTASGQAKPYFFPVQLADGLNVARPLENPPDHPHHKGIWCSVDEVNGCKHWVEKSVIRNADVKVITPSGDSVVLRVTNHWLDAANTVLFTETATVTVTAQRMMIYDTIFTVGEKPVTFADTKEGMFGIRLSDEIRGEAGGSIVNSAGEKTEAVCWGREANWVDYFHTLADGKTAGVALFDHPKNFRRSRYHVRNYGLFTLSPFGQHAYSKQALPENPLTLNPEQSIRLIYGLYVHSGDTAAAAVETRYGEFVRATE